MVVELVESVKELFLRPFLAGNRMHIVDQQHIGAAIVLVKQRHPVKTYTGNRLIHETFPRRVHQTHAGEVVHNRTTDGMHQVRLAHSHATVDKQRVVAAGRHGSHRFGRRVRKLVARSHHKLLKGKLRIELVGRILKYDLAGPGHRGISAPPCCRRRHRSRHLVHQLSYRKVQLADGRSNPVRVLLFHPRLGSIVGNRHHQLVSLGPLERRPRYPILVPLRGD